MKKRIIQYITVLLAFAAGIGFMNYATYMGNRDMTAVMAEATLPVAYAEKDGQLYNEMHGYVTEMDGGYMKESILGLSEDHRLGIAIEKYNARIRGISYEVRSLDMERLIENGGNLTMEDDGTYLRFQLDFKDLMERGEKYLLILKVETEEHEEVYYYSQISYLGENHVQECVDFAQQFHEAAMQKNGDFLQGYLEPNSKLMDGSTLGYVNINSRTGPVSWGDMQVTEASDLELTLTGIEGEIVSLKLEYRVEDADTGDQYQVSEAFQIRYSESRMYLNAYERTAEHVFADDGQLVEDGRIDFGIQGEELNYRKNDEENVIGFVQQGELWCYDFGQNRLSRVYGFQDGEDERGLYSAHDYRILEVEDSGSMDFLIYGYMNRGQYEGMCGILMCHYDALMNTVEEQFFLPSDHPYEVVKEEVGKLAVENENGKAWLSWRGMILQIDLTDASVQILAEGVSEDQIQAAENGYLAAWTNQDGSAISLLDARNGIVHEISAEPGETLQTLGFMEEDFLYGTAREEEIQTDMAGRTVIPMYRVIIRDHSGNEVREFNYESKGKYVTGVSIVENRIDLSCVALTLDHTYEEARSEPITYTVEPEEEKLTLEIESDEIRRNEYYFAYEGTLKSGSMKRPKVKLVLFEENRTLQIENEGTEGYFAWTFDGKAKAFVTLSDAVVYAYDSMGSVWKNGWQCCWQRVNRPARAQLGGFEELETLELPGDSITVCVQMLLRQKQIYTDVQAMRDEGMAVWEILTQELGDSCCLLPGCSLSMAQYYVANGSPVMAITDTGSAVLIVGYDAQNIIYYEPGQTELKRAGLNDSTAMFESAGNLFFSCLE